MYYFELDVIQRKHQVDNLQKDLEERQSQHSSVLQEKERLNTEKEKLAAAFARASELPIRSMKQSELLRDAISSLAGEASKQTAHSQGLETNIESVQDIRKVRRNSHDGRKTKEVKLFR